MELHVQLDYIAGQIVQRAECVGHEWRTTLTAHHALLLMNATTATHQCSPVEILP